MGSIMSAAVRGVAWTSVVGRASWLVTHPSNSTRMINTRGVATVSTMMGGRRDQEWLRRRHTPLNTSCLQRAARRAATGSGGVAGGSDGGGPAAESPVLATSIDETDDTSSSDSGDVPAVSSTPEVSESARLDAALWLEELTNQKTKSVLQVCLLSFTRLSSIYTIPLSSLLSP